MTQQANPIGSRISIARRESQTPFPGPAEWFTGSVQITPLFVAACPATGSGALVTFEPGARTDWHTHPLGQILIVTDGFGWVQCQGGEIAAIEVGDVVTIPPELMHWHGASPDGAMSHIAIQESTGGKAVDWMEKVEDGQYLQACAR